jgi:hypothetical protein
VADTDPHTPSNCTSRVAYPTSPERARSSAVPPVVRAHRTTAIPGPRSARASNQVGTDMSMRPSSDGTTLETFHAACLAVLRVRDEHSEGSVLVETSDALLVELGGQLARLVGVEGYRALLVRALQLAAEEFPALADVRPAAAPPGRLLGLQKMVRRAPPAEALEAIASTLTGVLWLLVNFIGEDLTLSLLREVWPWAAEPRPRMAELDRTQRLTA